SWIGAGFGVGLIDEGIRRCQVLRHQVDLARLEGRFDDFARTQAGVALDGVAVGFENLRVELLQYLTLVEVERRDLDHRLGTTSRWARSRRWTGQRRGARSA